MSTLDALKTLASLNCEELSEILEDNGYQNVADVILENVINGNLFLNLTEYEVQQFKKCNHEKIAKQIFAIQKSPNTLNIQDRFKRKNKELPRSKTEVNFASRPLPSLPTENKLGAKPKYVRFKSLPDKFSSDFVENKDTDYTCPPPPVAKTSPLYETRRILRKQNEESNYPLIYQSASSYYSCRSSISSGYGSILFEYDDGQTEKEKAASNLKQNEIEVETYYDVKNRTQIIAEIGTAESSDLPKIKNGPILKTESEKIISNFHDGILRDEATSSITKNSKIAHPNNLLSENKVHSMYKFINMDDYKAKLTSIEEQNDGTSSDDSLCEIEDKLILRLYKNELLKKTLK